MLLSMHIPKTAGTSLRMALREKFADEVLFCYRSNIFAKGVVIHFSGRLLEEKLDDKRRKKLVDYCQQNQIKCIHGHFTMSSLDEIFQDATYIMFLREPVDRLVSAYNHLKANMPAYGRQMTFEQFIEMDRTKNIYQQLGVGKLLDEKHFIGLTEQYDKSLELLARKLPVIGHLSTQQANVAQQKVFKRSNVTPELLTRIQETNQPDIDIYNTAKQRFEAECAALGI